MADIREEILNKEFHDAGLEDVHREVTTKPYKAIINAMDEYMKERVLEAFVYLSKTISGLHVDGDYVEFKVNGQWITKEQLFENFL